MQKNHIENMLNIGFEFEFYVSIAAQKTFYKNKDFYKAYRKTEKLYRKKYGIIVDEFPNFISAGVFFSTLLKQNFPNFDIGGTLRFINDSSILNKKNKTSLEVVFPYLSGDVALRNLDCVLSLLKNEDFSTNNSCGLHINISYKEEALNKPKNIFKLLKYLDIDKINNRFGREKNKNCISNKHSRVEFIDFIDVIYKSLYKSVCKGYDESDKITFEEMYGVAALLNNKPNKFNKALECQIKKMLLDNWYHYNRPALAPKINNNKKYIEFRSMGGKNYQYEDVIIKQSISEILFSFEKVFENIKKDSLNFKIKV